MVVKKTKKLNKANSSSSSSNSATMKLTGKKSMKKKGVWRDIKFPCSTKTMYIPDTPDTKNSVVAQAHFKGRSWEPKIAALLTKHGKREQQPLIWVLILEHTLWL